NNNSNSNNNVATHQYLLPLWHDSLVRWIDEHVVGKKEDKWMCIYVIEFFETLFPSASECTQLVTALQWHDLSQLPPKSLRMLQNYHLVLLRLCTFGNDKVKWWEKHLPWLQRYLPFLDCVDVESDVEHICEYVKYCLAHMRRHVYYEEVNRIAKVKEIHFWDCHVRTFLLKPYVPNLDILSVLSLYGDSQESTSKKEKFQVNITEDENENENINININESINTNTNTNTNATTITHLTVGEWLKRTVTWDASNPHTYLNDTFCVEHRAHFVRHFQQDDPLLDATREYLVEGMPHCFDLFWITFNAFHDLVKMLGVQYLPYLQRQWTHHSTHNDNLFGNSNDDGNDNNDYNNNNNNKIIIIIIMILIIIIMAMMMTMMTVAMT
ncbi:Phox domain-containing protein, partial [Reticulomyxa filosa]